jgi:hypothetical protein
MIGKRRITSARTGCPILKEFVDMRSRHLGPPIQKICKIEIGSTGVRREVVRRAMVWW